MQPKSEDDVQPVVAPTLAPNEATAPTSAEAPTAASPDAAAAPKPDEDMALFGPPLLLTGENRDAWEKIHAAASATIEPFDIFEKMWIRDIVDHQTEILRLRRLWTGLFSAGMQEALANVLRPLMSDGTVGFGERVQILARKFTLRQEGAVKEVKRLLETAGLTWDAVLAETMTCNVEIFERIDIMCMRAEARRDAALREIDHHRENFGRSVRLAFREIENTGYRVVRKGSQQDAA
jgi:hypothetical protein